MAGFLFGAAIGVPRRAADDIVTTQDESFFYGQRKRLAADIFDEPLHFARPRSQRCSSGENKRRLESIGAGSGNNPGGGSQRALSD